MLIAENNGCAATQSNATQVRIDRHDASALSRAILNSRDKENDSTPSRHAFNTSAVFMIGQTGALPGGTIDPDVPDQKYIAYAKEFDCVGRLSEATKPSSQDYCAAVAINSHWILTAAHAVEEGKEYVF